MLNFRELFLPTAGWIEGRRGKLPRELRAHDFLQNGFGGMVSMTRYPVPGFSEQGSYSRISLAFGLSSPVIL
jgi:hypothetical protein